MAAFKRENKGTSYTGEYPKQVKKSVGCMGWGALATSNSGLMTKSLI